MGRKNRNSTKGRNSGRKFDGRQWGEDFDADSVRVLINLDAKMLARLDKPARV